MSLFLLWMSAQLSFLFCMSMGPAFSLPRGQVPRHDMPGEAFVGWEGVREPKIGEADRPCGANHRSKGGEGIAGSSHRGAGSPEPWAIPRGAPTLTQWHQ